MGEFGSEHPGYESHGQRFQDAYDEFCESVNPHRADGMPAASPDSLESLAWAMQDAFYLMSSQAPPKTLQPSFEVGVMKVSADIRNSFNRLIEERAPGACSVIFVGLVEKSIVVYFAPSTLGTQIGSNAIPMFERMLGLQLHSVSKFANNQNLALVFTKPSDGS